MISQVSYKPLSRGRKIGMGVFALFILGTLVLLPAYYVHRFGIGHGHTAGEGKIIIAPIMALFYFILIPITLRRHRHYREDPVVIRWDDRSISLSKWPRKGTFPWNRVGELRLQTVKEARSAVLRNLLIETRDESGIIRKWQFDRRDLDLQGERIDDVIAAMERKRAASLSLPVSA